MLISFEDVTFAADWYCNRELFTPASNPDELKTYLPTFKKITLEDITEFMNKLFSPNSFFLEYSGYLSNSSKKKILKLLE